MTATQYIADFAEMDGDGVPDFAALKKVADGVYFRAAHGNRPDPTYAKLAPLARAAGLRVGAYGILEWWHGAASIAAQASAFVAAVGTPAPGDMPASMDVEFGDALPAPWTPGTTVVACEAYLAACAPLGHIALYTSFNQYGDTLRDLPSEALGKCSAWLKTGYYEQLHRPFNAASRGPLGHLPAPWRTRGTVGAWLQQFQGDCWGFGGLHQCDVSAHLPLAIGEVSERARSVQTIIGADADGDFGPKSEAALQTWQTAHGLPSTGVVDLDTWIALYRS